MNYNRFLNIYTEMGYEMRNKFIQEYNMMPIILREEEIDRFNDCMAQFIEENRSSRAIEFACMVFPELKDVPHPDEIPEAWGVTWHGRDVLTHAYIERVDQEKSILLIQMNELKQENEELKRSLDELSGEKQDNSVAENIYKKFFEVPVPRYRYKLLTENEIQWIFNHSWLSGRNREVFETCCSCGSLKGVAAKTGYSLSVVKHISAENIASVRRTVERCLQITKENKVENGYPSK